jgi:hypothetical protein
MEYSVDIYFPRWNSCGLIRLITSPVVEKQVRAITAEGMPGCEVQVVLVGNSCQEAETASDEQPHRYHLLSGMKKPTCDEVG